MVKFNQKARREDKVETNKQTHDMVRKRKENTPREELTSSMTLMGFCQM